MSLTGAGGLYILDVFPDKIFLVSATPSRRKSVCLQVFFWGLPCINIYQNPDDNNDDSEGGHVFKNFERGSTGYFYSDALELIRSIQRHSILITVYHNLEGKEELEPVGTCRVRVTDKFSEVINRAATCPEKHAICSVVKGQYNVMNKESIQIGTLNLYLRLTCFDKSLLKSTCIPTATDKSETGTNYLLPEKTESGFVLVPAERNSAAISGCRDDAERARASSYIPPVSRSKQDVRPAFDATDLICDTTVSEKVFEADESAITLSRQTFDAELRPRTKHISDICQAMLQSDSSRPVAQTVFIPEHLARVKPKIKDGLPICVSQSYDGRNQFNENMSDYEVAQAERVSCDSDGKVRGSSLPQDDPKKTLQHVRGTCETQLSAQQRGQINQSYFITSRNQLAPVWLCPTNRGGSVECSKQSSHTSRSINGFEVKQNTGQRQSQVSDIVCHKAESPPNADCNDTSDVHESCMYSATKKEEESGGLTLSSDFLSPCFEHFDQKIHENQTSPQRISLKHLVSAGRQILPSRQQNYECCCRKQSPVDEKMIQEQQINSKTQKVHTEQSLERTKSHGQPRTNETLKSQEHQATCKRQTSMEHEASREQQKLHKPQRSLHHQIPCWLQRAENQQAPSEQRTPRGQRTPSEQGISRDQRTPRERRTASEQRTPREQRTPSGHQTPSGQRTPHVQHIPHEQRVPCEQQKHFKQQMPHKQQMPNEVETRCEQQKVNQLLTSGELQTSAEQDKARENRISTKQRTSNVCLNSGEEEKTCKPEVPCEQPSTSKHQRHFEHTKLSDQQLASEQQTSTEEPTSREQREPCEETTLNRKQMPCEKAKSIEEQTVSEQLTSTDQEMSEEQAKSREPRTSSEKGKSIKERTSSELITSSEQQTSCEKIKSIEERTSSDQLTSTDKRMPNLEQMPREHQTHWEKEKSIEERTSSGQLSLGGQQKTCEPQVPCERRTSSIEQLMHGDQRLLFEQRQPSEHQRLCVKQTCSEEENLREQEVPFEQEMSCVQEMPCMQESPCMQKMSCMQESPCMQAMPCMQESPCMQEMSCAHQMPCVPQMACVHQMACVPQTPCVHQMACAQHMPCVPLMPCVQQTPCVHQMSCGQHMPFAGEMACEKDTLCEEEMPCEQALPCEQQLPCEQDSMTCEEEMPFQREMAKEKELLYELDVSYSLETSCEQEMPQQTPCEVGMPREEELPTNEERITCTHRVPCEQHISSEQQIASEQRQPCEDQTGIAQRTSSEQQMPCVLQVPSDIPLGSPKEHRSLPPQQPIRCEQRKSPAQLILSNQQRYHEYVRSHEQLRVHEQQRLSDHQRSYEHTKTLEVPRTFELPRLHEQVKFYKQEPYGQQPRGQTPPCEKRLPRDNLLNFCQMALREVLSRHGQQTSSGRQSPYEQQTPCGWQSLYDQQTAYTRQPLHKPQASYGREYPFEQRISCGRQSPYEQQISGRQSPYEQQISGRQSPYQQRRSYGQPPLYVQQPSCGQHSPYGKQTFYGQQTPHVTQTPSPYAHQASYGQQSSYGDQTPHKQEVPCEQPSGQPIPYETRVVHERFHFSFNANSPKEESKPHDSSSVLAQQINVLSNDANKELQLSCQNDVSNVVVDNENCRSYFMSIQKRDTDTGTLITTPVDYNTVVRLETPALVDIHIEECELDNITITERVCEQRSVEPTMVGNKDSENRASPNKCLVETCKKSHTINMRKTNPEENPNGNNEQLITVLVASSEVTGDRSTEELTARANFTGSHSPQPVTPGVEDDDVQRRAVENGKWETIKTGMNLDVAMNDVGRSKNTMFFNTPEKNKFEMSDKNENQSSNDSGSCVNADGEQGLPRYGDVQSGKPPGQNVESEDGVETAHYYHHPRQRLQYQHCHQNLGSSWNAQGFRKFYGPDMCFTSKPIRTLWSVTALRSFKLGQDWNSKFAEFSAIRCKRCQTVSPSQDDGYYRRRKRHCSNLVLCMCPTAGQCLWLSNRTS